MTETKADYQLWDTTEALIGAGAFMALIAPWIGVSAATMALAKTVLLSAGALGSCLYLASKIDGDDERQTGQDRDGGVYVDGVQRSGKSTFLLHERFLPDIRSGNGAGWVTTHGARDVAREVRRVLGSQAERMLVVYSPPKTRGLNIMGGGDPYRAANRVATVFDRMFPDLGPLQQQLLYSAALVVSEERPGATLEDVRRFCDDPHERRQYAITSEIAQSAWAMAKPDSVSGLVFRIGKLLRSPRLAKGLADPNGIDLDDVVRLGKVLVCDLTQDDTSDALILAQAVVGMLQQVSVRRPARAPSWPCYLDEFQSYMDDSVEIWITQGGKRHMPVTLAHQNRHQLPEGKMRSATLSCGTIYAFNLELHDARELAPVLGVDDPLKLVRLPRRTYYARVLQNGRPRYIGPRKVPFIGRRRPPRWLREIRRHVRRLVWGGGPHARSGRRAPSHDDAA